MEIKISDVLRMLDEGKSRKEIAAYYGLPYTFMRDNVFTHPLIKNKRAKRSKKIDVNIVDDASFEDIIDETELNNPNENK